MGYTQDDKMMAVDTPLGKDVLLLTGFSGTEGLSRLSEFSLEMLSSQRENIASEEIVGKKSVTVKIVLTEGETFFDGIFSDFSQTGTKGHGSEFASYSGTMVPWLWLLTRTTDSRVFENCSVPEIIEKIFNEKKAEFAGIDINYKIKLGKEPDSEKVDEYGYLKREFCIQYRETDFNFISRLMEEEGIYYFFQHENKKHTLVLVDKKAEHLDCPKQESAELEITVGSSSKKDVITSFGKTEGIMAGKYTLNDYNFRKHDTDLKVEKNSKRKLEPGEREFYDYPGLYEKRKRGDFLVNLRIQEQETGIKTMSGTSSCRAFKSGYRYELQKHPVSDMNKKYVLVSLSHDAWQGGYRSGESADSDYSYGNSFTCIPFDDVQYRPPLTTPKPIIPGPQTAIVVGPDKAKSHTDTDKEIPDMHYGMVQIQFHWDREKYKAIYEKPEETKFWDGDKKRNEKTAIWVRVAYPYAGLKHGAQFTPLIGDEVMVDFLEGDPDRPVVVGSLFKGQHKSLIKPEKMIKNEILTPYGHCLHFDDKGVHITLKTGGGEVINMAEGKVDKTHFGNNIKAYTADGHFLHLAQGTDLKGIKAATKNGHTVLMQKDTGVSCIQIFTEKHHSMTFDDENKIINITDTSAALAIDMDSAKAQIRITVAAGAAGGGWILLEDPNGKISQKAKDIDAYATQSVTIDATTKLTLKCGASSIEMTPATITINSPQVKINC